MEKEVKAYVKEEYDTKVEQEGYKLADFEGEGMQVQTDDMQVGDIQVDDAQADNMQVVEND